MTPRAPIFHLLAILTAAFFVSACTEDVDHLAVLGAVTVEASGAETGFNFSTQTRLDDDRVAPEDGRVAGHCTILRGAEGLPDVVSVGISRPGAAAQGNAMRSFTLRIDDPSAPARARVEATLGDTLFAAETTASTCEAALTYIDLQSGLVVITASCLLESTVDTATAQLTVTDLEYAGCDVN